jgi:hypothetical protein
MAISPISETKIAGIGSKPAAKYKKCIQFINMFRIDGFHSYNLVDRFGYSLVISWLSLISANGQNRCARAGQRICVTYLSFLNNFVSTAQTRIPSDIMRANYSVHFLGLYWLFLCALPQAVGVSIFLDQYDHVPYC